MNRGVIQAKKVIQDLNIDRPNKYILEDIISGYSQTNNIRQPIIYYKYLSSADGRLVSSRDSSVITINSNINSNSRQRFTLAHEFGHFNMHTNKPNIFNCTENEMMDWKQYKLQETEANYFAAELLMPEDIFYNFSKKSKFSKKFLLEISELFQTSITSTAIRFAEIGNDPVLIVCSQNEKIKWFFRNRNFPYAEIKTRSCIPQCSVMYEYYYENKSYDGPEEIDPSVWNINKENDLKYYEECVSFKSYDYHISFIYVM